jgi:hypothetical protein
MSTREKLLTALAAGVGITLSITVLLAVGWRSERETSETEFSVEVNYKNKREKQSETSGVPPHAGSSAQQADPQTGATVREEAPPKRNEGGSTPTETTYVGGMWVSGRSTMRYSINDDQGRVEMYGYDVMRGQHVFVGSGRMVGKQLVIPRFYSFLDNTYGTLKLDLSDDGKTFLGNFEGLNASQTGPVTLVRLP